MIPAWGALKELSLHHVLDRCCRFPLGTGTQHMAHCSICPSPAEQSDVGRAALGQKTDPLLEEVGRKKIQKVFFPICQLSTREWIFLPSDAASSYALPRYLVLVKREEKEELCIILHVPFSGHRAVCSCVVENSVPHWALWAHCICNLSINGFCKLFVSVSK